MFRITYSTNLRRLVIAWQFASQPPSCGISTDGHDFNQIIRVRWNCNAEQHITSHRLDRTFKYRRKTWNSFNHIPAELKKCNIKIQFTLCAFAQIKLQQIYKTATLMVEQNKQNDWHVKCTFDFAVLFVPLVWFWNCSQPIYGMVSYDGV